MLIVGDSLVHNSNFRLLESVTNTTIKTAKAYSSAWDNTARFSQQNVTDITKNELKKSAYKRLVLGSPTVDITNLNTNSDNLDGFKEKIGMYCMNMMKVAHDAIENHPELENVTIMSHAPRYDTVENDSFGLKSTLATFANSYMLELWIDSPLKHKIVIGSHDNLECSGILRAKRFTADLTGRFDGVEMYGAAGKRAYTESVLNILLSPPQPDRSLERQVRYDDHSNCPQSQYARLQNKSRTNQNKNVQYSVPTYNRYESLGN